PPGTRERGAACPTTSAVGCPADTSARVFGCSAGATTRSRAATAGRHDQRWVGQGINGRSDQSHLGFAPPATAAAANPPARAPAGAATVEPGGAARIGGCRAARSTHLDEQRLARAH